MLNEETVISYRFGPRQIRAESALLRAYNGGTRAAPYESLMVADIGDVNVNVYDLKDTCKRIREAYRKILATGCIPLTMGESTFVYIILFDSRFCSWWKDNRVFISVSSSGISY